MYKVNGGNFGHGVIHGHDSLSRNKRKIHLITTYTKALTNLPRVFFAANNFDTGVTPHVRSYPLYLILPRCSMSRCPSDYKTIALSNLR